MGCETKRVPTQGEKSLAHVPIPKILEMPASSGFGQMALDPLHSRIFRLKLLPDKTMKVGYARVSTFEQDLDLQVDALKADGCDRIFLDKGESGANENRPEWDKCLDHLRKGDTLVIWRLDRASRSTKHLIELAEKLEAKGVELRSLREQIDTSTAMGKFFFRMTASIAELERDIIRERTLAGLAAAKSRGRKGGRKKSITKGQELEAKRLVAAGELSVTDICEQVGISPLLYRSREILVAKAVSLS